MKLAVRAVAALALILTVVGASTTTAAAAPGGGTSRASQIQRQIDDLLQQVPGGTQINRDEVSWQGGQVIATVRVPGTAEAAGSICSGSSICLYANANQGGTKVTYRCGTWDVRPWFPPGTRAGVSSWHATTTGHLSNIPVGSPPGTPGAGIRITRGLGNVPGWFNDRAVTVSVCN